MSTTRVNANTYSRSKFAAEKPVKKHCGVCQKAGRSESEYTSHYTKSVPGPQGVVICPTILNNECSYCYERGHFKSACPQLAAKEKMQNRSTYQEKSLQSKPKKSELPVIPVSRGGFSALAASDSDSDEDRPIGKKRKIDTPAPVKEAWPALATNTAAPVKPEKPSFAAVISAPAPVKKEDTSRPNICGFTVLTKGGAKPAAAPVYYERNEAEKAAYARAKKSWTDPDSDDDEDEDW